MGERHLFNEVVGHEATAVPRFLPLLAGYSVVVAADDENADYEDAVVEEDDDVNVVVEEADDVNADKLF